MTTQPSTAAMPGHPQCAEAPLVDQSEVHEAIEEETDSNGGGEASIQQGHVSEGLHSRGADGQQNFG